MAALTKRRELIASKALDSRIQSANVKSSEKWLGYFVGPMIISMCYFVTASTYLNVFYTDVLKVGAIWSGAFLTVMPIVSKIIDAITNLIMGYVIDRTKSRQGKARPWILISAPVLMIAGILLYAVPHASQTVQVIWITVSYNLFYAVAYTIYNMSHALMVPLSTRNHKQRDLLALFTQMGVSMIPGAVIYMVIPLTLQPWMGVDPKRWLTAMSVVSILFLAGALIEYFFTKERITEENRSLPESSENKTSIWEQFRLCLKDRYWILVVLINFVWQIQNNIVTSSSIYFSNWVLGTYNDGITLTLMNAIGQFPLGLGVFLLWPLVRKYGKQKIYVIGMLLAAVGSIPILLAPTRLPVVLGALFIRSFGLLPSYLLASLLGDALDHVEWKSGLRVDGISGATINVICTASAGIALGIFNAGLAGSGYVPPASDGSWVAQSASTVNFITLAYAGIPLLCFLVTGIMMIFFNSEKYGDQARADITARHRAEAEARGEVYVSPEEKAALEEAEQDRIAEEKRIEELKGKCARKGLSFEEEEAKYQAKLQKAAEKAARKQKK